MATLHSACDMRVIELVDMNAISSELACKTLTHIRGACLVYARTHKHVRTHEFKVTRAQHSIEHTGHCVQEIVKRIVVVVLGLFVDACT